MKKVKITYSVGGLVKTDTHIITKEPITIDNVINFQVFASADMPNSVSYNESYVVKIEFYATQ